MSATVGPNRLVEVLETGLAVVEWVLIIGVIVVPLSLMLFQVARAFANFYSLTSWIVELPFP